MQKCEIEVICADAVERAHTKSLDANDKLIQTRPHVRDTIASKKRQVIMRKGKSTIRSLVISACITAGLHNIRPASCKSFLSCRKYCQSSTSNKQSSIYNFFHTATKSPHRNEIDFCGPRQIYIYIFGPSSFLSCAGLCYGNKAVATTSYVFRSTRYCLKRLCFAHFYELPSGVGGKGCKCTPKSFDLSKILAKSLNLSKIREKWHPTLFDFKKWRPTLGRKNIKTFFLRSHQKKSSRSL